MDTTFKAAEISDIDTLLIFMREFYELENILFDPTIARDALTELLNNKSFGGVWLIQLQEEAIGYVVLGLGYSLEYRGRDGFIDELYIRSSYQNQEIGTKTIKFIEEVCSSLGIHALHLEAARENTSAQRLYHRVGFEDNDRYLLTKWL